MFKITYKTGLSQPIIVEAANEEEAKKIGLSKYRYNSDWCNHCDTKTVDQVIESVEKIEE